MSYMERSRADWYIRRYTDWYYIRSSEIHGVRELPIGHKWKAYVGTVGNNSKAVLQECTECSQVVYLTWLVGDEILTWCYYGFSNKLEECSLVRMRKALL